MSDVRVCSGHTQYRPAGLQAFQELLREGLLHKSAQSTLVGADEQGDPYFVNKCSCERYIVLRRCRTRRPPMRSGRAYKPRALLPSDTNCVAQQLRCGPYLNKISSGHEYRASAARTFKNRNQRSLGQILQVARKS